MHMPCCVAKSAGNNRCTSVVHANAQASTINGRHGGLVPVERLACGHGRVSRGTAGQHHCNHHDTACLANSCRDAALAMHGAMEFQPADVTIWCAWPALGSSDCCTLLLISAVAVSSMAVEQLCHGTACCMSTPHSCVISNKACQLLVSTASTQCKGSSDHYMPLAVGRK